MRGLNIGSLIEFTIHLVLIDWNVIMRTYITAYLNKKCQLRSTTRNLILNYTNSYFKIHLGKENVNFSKLVESKSLSNGVH